MAGITSPLDQDDILLVEDDAVALKSLTRILEAERYVVRTASTGAQAMQAIERTLPNIVLLDLKLPDVQGVDLLRSMISAGVKYVIIVSGTEDVELTHKCLREGAYDFVLKPAHRHELLQAIRRATSSYQIGQITAFNYPLELAPGFGALETQSSEGQKLLLQIKSVASQSNLQALITGAGGMFKRDIAALLHHYHDRQGKALLINCALENRSDSIKHFSKNSHSSSYIEIATTGTLVLDDLSLLPLDSQTALAGHIKMVTGNQPGYRDRKNKQRCNVIGILKESPEQAISANRLSTELYSCLKKNHVVIPSLAERPGDVITFAHQAVFQLNQLLDCEKSLSPDFLKFLVSQNWEGNLVELKNYLLRAYRATADGDEILFNPVSLSSTPCQGNNINSDVNSISPFVGMTLRDAENRLIEATLAAHNGNKRKASKILEISTKTLYNRTKA